MTRAVLILAVFCGHTVAEAQAPKTVCGCRCADGSERSAQLLDNGRCGSCDDVCPAPSTAATSAAPRGPTADERATQAALSAGQTMASMIAGMRTGPSRPFRNYDPRKGERRITVPNPEHEAATRELAKRQDAASRDDLVASLPGATVAEDAARESPARARLDVTPEAWQALQRGDLDAAARGTSGSSTDAASTGGARAKTSAGEPGPQVTRPHGDTTREASVTDELVEHWHFDHETSTRPQARVHDGVFDARTRSDQEWYFGSRYDNATVSVIVDRVSGSSGIVLRERDGHSVSFEVDADSGRAILWRHERGRKRELAAGRFAPTRAPLSLRVIATEERLDGYVNDEHVLAAIVAPGELREGRIGLRATGAARVAFDNLVIVRLPADVTRLVHEGDALAAAQKWRDAASRYEQAQTLAAGNGAIARRIADAWLRVGDPRALDAYARYVDRFGRAPTNEPALDATRVRELARAAKPPPQPLNTARRLVRDAREHARANRLRAAREAYVRAAAIAPWYADAYRGIALLDRDEALRDPRGLERAAASYAQLAEVTQTESARREAANEARALRRIAAGLAASPTIVKVVRGDWPYGRTAFYVDVLSIGGAYSIAAASASLMMTIEAGVRLPLLPRCSVGGFWGFARTGIGEPSVPDSAFDPTYLGGKLRVALLAAGDKSGYGELYLQVGGGQVRTASWETVGRAPFFLLGVGGYFATSSLFGFGMSAGYYGAHVDELADETGATRATDLDLSAIGLQASFTLAL